MQTNNSKKIQWIPPDFIFGKFGEKPKKALPHIPIRHSRVVLRSSCKVVYKNSIEPPWIKFLRGQNHKTMERGATVCDLKCKRAISWQIDEIEPIHTKLKPLETEFERKKKVLRTNKSVNY